VYTSGTQKREIKITIAIEPDEDRNMGHTTVTCEAKLAGLRPVGSKLFFGKKDGQYVAVTHNLKEPTLFDPPSGAIPLSPWEKQQLEGMQRIDDRITGKESL